MQKVNGLDPRPENSADLSSSEKVTKTADGTVPPEIGTVVPKAEKAEKVPRVEKIHGKPVLYRDAKTVLNMASDFAHKLLCTGPVLNLGDACVFSCVYCYVASVVRKLIFDLLGTHTHQDVVVRRRNALEVLKAQLAKNKQKNEFNVVYSSSLVDIAATMELLRETAGACIILLEQTIWDIRLLTKSSFLPQLVKLIPEKYHKRLILGVSTGTFDDELGKVIEKGTALVSKRIESLHWLQDHGFRTFAMVCPSLPQEDYAAFAEQARDLLRYDRCEHVWCEVINVRGESFTQTIAALDAAGLINERDQLPAGIVAGAAVFVCDNLSFSGEVRLSRKHSVHLQRDLPQLAARAVGQLMDAWHHQDQRIDAYKGYRMRDKTAHDLIVRSVDVGAATNRMIPVLKEWREPSHPEFGDRSAWSLFNAFTEVLKGNLPDLPKRTEALHALFDQQVKLTAAQLN